MATAAAGTSTYRLPPTGAPAPSIAPSGALPLLRETASAPEPPSIAPLPAPAPSAPLPAPANAVTAESVTSIEQRLADVERQLAAAQEALKLPKPPDTFPITFQPTMEFQTDAAWFSQSALNIESVGVAQDGIDFRRARIGMYGNVGPLTDYRVEWDFALAGRPSFLDVYATQNELPILGNVRVGHYFQPFCMSRIVSNRFDVFMERPLLTVFAPARRTGVMAFDQNEDLTMTWATSAYGGNNDNFGDVITHTGGWAGAGRVTWLPYYDEPSGGRYYTHLGAAYSYSGVDDNKLQFASTPEIRLGEGAFIEPIFVNTGIFAARRYQLVGAEAAWNRGPWLLQSEFVYVPIDRLGGANGSFHGAYLLTSYFLTGEHRPYNRQNGNFARVIPLEDFFRVRRGERLFAGKGAWQVAARWSYLNLNGADVRGGVLNDLTIGLNWYLNRYTRVYFNYIHAILDDPVRGTSQADAFGIRFQLDYQSF